MSISSFSRILTQPERPETFLERIPSNLIFVIQLDVIQLKAVNGTL